MFADEHEDWGWEAGPNPYTHVLSTVSLIFGGLSVVALLGAASSDLTSWVLDDVVAKWDAVLGFVFWPLVGVLEAGIREVRGLGFDAALRPWWPHAAFVALLVGLCGFANVRGWGWVRGAAWFTISLTVGFVFLAGAGLSGFVSLDQNAGFDLGARVTALAFGIAAVLALVLRVLLYVWPEIVFVSLINSGRFFGAIRVALCFVGAGLILAADGLAQIFLG